MKKRIFSPHKGKGLRHLVIQRKLQKHLLPHCVQLEVAFPEIRRIADVVWQEKQIVFEIQCSPITAAEIQQRSKDYRSIGYHIVWIFHAETFFKLAHSLEKILERIPHYFTDIGISGFGEIFDRTRHKTYPIQIQNPYNPSALKNNALPLHLQMRATFWEVGFNGDLLSKPQSSSENWTVKLIKAYKNWLDKRLSELWH